MSELTLESLRAQGAQHHDPARFRYLEVLAERLPAQPPAVRELLARRLQAALADYASGVQASPSRPAVAAAVAKAPSALQQLNQDLGARVRAEGQGVLGSAGASVPDLPSVRRFSEVWSKISAEQQLAQALTRGPENAGPLNSHRLVLRSLALMRALSPDYLRLFLSQMDSLLWLERAAAKPPRAARAPAKHGRSGRSARP